METPRYAIRDAKEADVPAILAMHAQSWLDTYPNEAAGITYEWVEEKIGRWSSEENREKRRDTIRRCKDNPNAMYRVAVNDHGEIVGIIEPRPSIANTDSRKMLIQSIWSTS